MPRIVQVTLVDPEGRSDESDIEGEWILVGHGSSFKPGNDEGGSQNMRLVREFRWDEGDDDENDA